MIIRIVAPKKELDVDPTAPIPREGDYVWIDNKERYKVFKVEFDYPNNMVRIYTQTISN